jgi:hypothetical protein
MGALWISASETTWPAEQAASPPQAPAGWAALGHKQPLVGAWLASASCPKRVSNVLSSNSTNSAWTAGELAGGSMNPQHLKPMSDWSDLYRHLITLAFTQHGPAQRGFAADDLNELSAADQLHAAPIRAEKELLLLVVGIDQADQRAELYTFAGVVGARAELAPIGHRLADGVGATSLAGGQVGSFETQCVVFVFGDAFFVSRRFMGRPRCLFGLQQVFGEPFQHLLLKQ